MEEDFASIKSSVTRRKGRGFSAKGEERFAGIKELGDFDRLETEEAATLAQKSIEGWVVFVTGINEEATEEDVHDRFADYGKVRNICINLDHRTGFVKGYALVEYGTLKEAQNAIDCLDGTKLLDSVIHCEFAFIRASSHQRK